MPFPPVPCVIFVGLACHIRRSRVTSPPASAMRARSAARGSGTGVPARGPSSSRNPTPGCPKPGRKLLLRRDGDRGLPWTRGRLGDGTGHRAPQPWRRPPPGGESYATRRPGGSPDGRLGGGRETRHTRATADGPRDGAVTRNGSGPGRSRAGDGALGGSFRPALDRAAVATAESRGNRRAYPRCPSERSSRSARIRSRPDSPPPRSGRRGVPRARGPRAAHAGQPGRVGGCPTGAWPAPTATRPRGPVTGSCPAAP